MSRNTERGAARDDLARSAWRDGGAATAIGRAPRGWRRRCRRSRCPSWTSCESNSARASVSRIFERPQPPLARSAHDQCECGQCDQPPAVTAAESDHFLPGRRNNPFSSPPTSTTAGLGVSEPCPGLLESDPSASFPWPLLPSSSSRPRSTPRFNSVPATFRPRSTVPAPTLAATLAAAYRPRPAVCLRRRSTVVATVPAPRSTAAAAPTSVVTADPLDNGGGSGYRPCPRRGRRWRRRPCRQSTGPASTVVVVVRSTAAPLTPDRHSSRDRPGLPRRSCSWIHRASRHRESRPRRCRRTPDRHRQSCSWRHRASRHPDSRRRWYRRDTGRRRRSWITSSEPPPRFTAAAGIDGNRGPHRRRVPAATSPPERYIGRRIRTHAQRSRQRSRRQSRRLRRRLRAPTDRLCTLRATPVLPGVSTTPATIRPSPPHDPPAASQRLHWKERRAAPPGSACRCRNCRRLAHADPWAAPCRHPSSGR